jgi:hypothetical protein
VFTKNFRNAVRKNYNRLEEREVKFECEHRPPRVADMAEITRLSACKHEDNKHSHWEDAGRRAFFQRLIETVPAEIQFLRVNGQNSLYLLNFLAADGVYAFDTSYDRTHKDLSLGRISFVESIKRFFEQQPGLAFHSAGAGLGYHKRGHYARVDRIYAYTLPGNTRAAERRAAVLRQRGREVATQFEADLKTFQGHE